MFKKFYLKIQSLGKYYQKTLEVKHLDPECMCLWATQTHNVIIGKQTEGVHKYPETDSFTIHAEETAQLVREIAKLKQK